MPTDAKKSGGSERGQKMRCFTRAVKNAYYLREHDPEHFAQDPGAPGFGTGVPIEILHRLHLLTPDAPELKRQPEVSALLRRDPMPRVRKLVRESRS